MQSNNSRFTKEEQAILKTLIYSDIFHFPLNKNELWKFLITEKKIEKNKFEKALKTLINTDPSAIYHINKQIITKDGYYCLSGREEIIRQRKINRSEVTKKLAMAKKAAYYLSLIPSIQLIGISGGLSLGNVTKDDDIDFFIITKKKTLFMTRFWILCVLEWLGLRRKRNEKKPADKICIQMRPLFERNDMYRKFLVSNKWVGKYLANTKSEHFSFDKHWRTTYVSLRVISFFLSPLEMFAEKVQRKYMKKHQTTEIISNNHIAFHPNDYRIKTMEVLRSKYDKLGLLTNL